MAALRELVATFETKFNTKPIEKGDKAVGGLASKMKVASVVAAAAGAAMAVAFFKIGNSVDALGKKAQTLDIPIEKLRGWQHAAELAGVGNAALETSFKKVQQSVFDAGEGSLAAVDALDDLGLSYEQLHGSSPEQQLLKVGQALNQVEDTSTRNALAMKLLGRSGADLNRVFADPALAENVDKYAEWSGVNKEVYEGFAKTNDALATSKLKLEGATTQLASALLPAMTELLDVLGPILTDLSKWIRESEGAKVAVKAMAGIIAGVLLSAIYSMTAAFVAANLAALPWIVVIGLLILVFEDLYQMLTGGESVFGSVMDSLVEWIAWFVAEASAWIDAVIADFLFLWEAIKEGGAGMVAAFMGYWESIKAGFKSVADSIVDPVINAIAQIKKMISGAGDMVKNFIAKIPGASLFLGGGGGDGGGDASAPGGTGGGFSGAPGAPGASTRTTNNTLNAPQTFNTTGGGARQTAAAVGTTAGRANHQLAAAMNGLGSKA